MLWLVLVCLGACPDLDRDGDVDADDFGALQRCYGRMDVACRPADLDHSGQVNTRDTAILRWQHTGAEVLLAPPEGRSVPLLFAAPIGNVSLITASPDVKWDWPVVGVVNIAAANQVTLALPPGWSGTLYVQVRIRPDDWLPWYQAWSLK